MKMEGWELTDPDNLQYGRQVMPFVFEFREYNRNEYPVNQVKPANRDQLLAVWDKPEFWVEERIDLSDLTLKQIQEYIGGYGYTLHNGQTKGYQNLFSQYDRFSLLIIAKCIFEQTNGLY